MIWLLDTNACIRYLNGRAPILKERIDGTNEANPMVCSVVKAELFAGAHRSNNPLRALEAQRRFLSRFVSLVFDDRGAEVYGIVRATLEKAGTSIGPNDLLIASIALANSVTLVTHNTSEFRRVNGLRIEDWEN